MLSVNFWGGWRGGGGSMMQCFHSQRSFIISVFLTGYKDPASWSVEEPFTSSHNWPRLYFNKGRTGSTNTAAQ